MKIGKLEIKGYNKITYGSSKFNPPHIILWKLIWSIPFYAGVLISCFALLFAEGYKVAVDFFNKA